MSCPSIDGQDTDGTIEKEAGRGSLRLVCEHVAPVTWVLPDNSVRTHVLVVRIFSVGAQMYAGYSNPRHDNRLVAWQAIEQPNGKWKAALQINDLNPGDTGIVCRLAMRQHSMCVTGAYTCSSDTSSSLTGDEQVLQPIFKVQQSHHLQRPQHSLTEQTVYVFVTDSMCAYACASMTPM